jgi:hypothetical protein
MEIMLTMEASRMPEAELGPRRRLLQRIGRLIVPGASIAIAAALLTGRGDHSVPPTPAHDVLLLYVGAEDCAPCRAWQNGEGVKFRASAAFPLIRYREVKSRHLEDVLNDDNWPDELRVYRSQLRPSDGVPLWLVVSDDEIVERRFGAAAWRESILPRLRSLLRPPRA